MTRIGILGGGQLGRMTIEAARPLLGWIEVLSPEYPSPAADLADVTHLGELMDYESVLEMASEVDVVSYEIEHVNIEALFALERAGKAVVPAAGVLAIIQDKVAQKRLMDRVGIPTAAWTLVGETGDAVAVMGGDRAGIGAGQPATTETLIAAAERLGGFPVVQKARRGGYDGRGVAIIRHERDALPVSEGGRLLPVPSFVEEAIDFSKELAVVVARDRFGNEAAWPCVEMMFDPRANLCDSVLIPAREGPAAMAEAERVARAMVDALHGAALSEEAGGTSAGAAGIFGVELFLARDGRVLVNETAPRPHNSGHVTMEASATSQFLQYYRILSGFPLGSTELLRPARMVNLLGEAGASGVPVYDGLEQALAVPGVAVHLYGKREVRSFRKMGHLTAVGATVEEAMARAEQARAMMKIRGSGRSLDHRPVMLGDGV